MTDKPAQNQRRFIGKDQAAQDRQLLDRAEAVKRGRKPGDTMANFYRYINPPK